MPFTEFNYENAVLRWLIQALAIIVCTTQMPSEIKLNLQLSSFK